MPLPHDATTLIRTTKACERAASVIPMVDAILDWRWTWLIARISLTGPFMVGAFMKLSD